MKQDLLVPDLKSQYGRQMSRSHHSNQKNPRPPISQATGGYVARSWATQHPLDQLHGGVDTPVEVTRVHGVTPLRQ